MSPALMFFSYDDSVEIGSKRDQIQKKLHLDSSSWPLLSHSSRGPTQGTTFLCKSLGSHIQII